MSPTVRSATNSNQSQPLRLGKPDRAEVTFTDLFNSINHTRHFCTYLPESGLVKASCRMVVADYCLLRDGEMGTKPVHSPKVWQALPSTTGYENTNALAATSIKRLSLILMGDLSATFRTSYFEDSISQKPLLWEKFPLKNNLSYF